MALISRIEPSTKYLNTFEYTPLERVGGKLEGIELYCTFMQQYTVIAILYASKTLGSTFLPITKSESEAR